MTRIRLRHVTSTIGLLTIAASAFFVMGYMFGRPEFYTWPNPQSVVAFPSCLMFFLLGTSTFILSSRKEQILVNGTHDTLVRLENQMDDLKHQMNGRLDQLLKATRELGQAQGRETERMSQHDPKI